MSKRINSNNLTITEDAKLIADAKTYFEGSILKTDSVKTNSLNAYKTPIQLLTKTISWDSAYTQVISIGKIVVLPVHYKENNFIKVGVYELPISSLTRLFIYKNKEGSHAEVVTRIPDTAYLNNSSKYKPFSGIINVWDWQGNFIKGFSIKADGSQKSLGAPEYKLNSSSSLQVLKLKTNDFTCTTYSWGTCGSGDGGATWYCHEDGSYTECSGDGGNINEAEGVPTGGDYGGGGGGSSSGNSGTYTPSPMLDKLMKNTSSLSQTDKNSLESLLAKIYQDCVGMAIYNYLSSNNVTFNFAVNSSITQEALYNPANDAMTIKNPSKTATITFQEELFHAYQNKTYSNGTSQYLNAPGGANIEFESKVIRDLNAVLGSSNAAILTFPSQNYQDWLKDISSGFTSFPTSFTANQTNQYFTFMQDFVNQVPGYSNYKIDSNFSPQAMFKLINSSSCTH